MTRTVDIPIVNITIYRLDIYRLLTLLLADEIIVKDAIFKDIGNDNFDNEVNRLLVLIAVVTRQLLRSYPDFVNNLCGSFYHNYPADNTPKELIFKKACSMIVHATDINIKSQDYSYRDHPTDINIKSQDYSYSELVSKKPNEVKDRYYQGIITIIGEKKERAELNFKKFAKYCIKLSNKIKEGSDG